jgi:DNA-binding phage protein
MAKKAVDLVAANVDLLMNQAGLSNAALEKKTGGRLTRSTIDRMRKGQGSAGIESVAEIARAFGLELWQLCVMDLDPERLPALADPLSGQTADLEDTERILLARFRDLSPAFQRLVLNDLNRYLEAEHQTSDKKGASGKRRA